MKKLWEESINFVGKNRFLIFRKIKNFMPYTSGLSFQDFYSEALLVAAESRKKLMERFCSRCEFFDAEKSQCKRDECEIFPKLFWKMLKIRFASLADVPSEYKLAKDAKEKENKSKKPFKRVEVAEVLTEENYLYSTILSDEKTPEVLLLQKEEENSGTKINLSQLLSLVCRSKKLNRKEKEILFLLLQKKESYDDIKNKLNYKHKAGVIMSFKRALDKIRKETDVLFESVN